MNFEELNPLSINSFYLKNRRNTPINSLLFVVFMTFRLLSFGQMEAVVVDSSTKAGIPLVNIWIEGTYQGTTASVEGVFAIDAVEGDRLVLSAVGYEKRTIIYDTERNIVELLPSINELSLVTVKPRNGERQKLGSFKKSEIEYAFGSRGIPSMIGRFFNVEDRIEAPRYLVGLNIVTISSIKGAQFNLRLYCLGENGEPEALLYDKNILVSVKKGKRLTKVDLAHLLIPLPERGLFVVAETLIIESNIHRRISHFYDEKSEQRVSKEIMSYQPIMASLPTHYGEHAWLFMSGEWINMADLLKEVKDFGKHLTGALAVEIILTD